MESQSTTFCNYPDEAVNGASLWGGEEDEEETFFFSHGEFQPGVCISNYPERLGISSDVTVPALPHSNSTNHGADFNFGANNMYCTSADQGCDFGSDCCYDFDYYNPMDLAARDNWGMEAKQAAAVVPVVEDSSTRIGRYTVEERKDRILRYLKKRNQRNFNKTIKYACRKTLADRRVRVRGRFARNNGSCEDEMMPMQKTNEADPQQRNDLFFGDSLQMKQDGDEWLQAAIASLIYLPYVSG